MSLLEIFLTAISLSLDAVAIAIAAEMLHRLSLKQSLKISFFFGSFQLFMPVLGYFLGSNFRDPLHDFGNYIGFTALFLLGSKMLFESFSKPDKDEINKEKHLAETKILTMLAITTSIDAFIVGITFNFINVNILLAIATIGVVTFILCLLGILIGRKSKHLLGNRIEIIGALILILLSFKILLA